MSTADHLSPIIRISCQTTGPSSEGQPASPAAMVICRVSGTRDQVRIEQGDPGTLQPLGERTKWSWFGRAVDVNGQAQDADLVFLIRFPVPRKLLTDFTLWYTGEHGPLLRQEPRWHGYALMAASDTNAQFTLAVAHWIAAQDVLESPARRTSRNTAAWHRWTRHNWFDVAFERLLLERHSGCTLARFTNALATPTPRHSHR